MKRKFNPLVFLASLGAGWIAVIPFSLLQYSFPHGSWLVSIVDIFAKNLSTGQLVYFYALFAVMIVFSLLHVVLTAIFIKQSIGWFKTSWSKEYINDPLKNAWILAPLVSISMTMNIVIGPLRFFIPWFAEHLQDFMIPALIFWLVLRVIIMWVEVNLLKKAFVQWYDVEKINFWRLLHPFALGMLSVIGAWIAALVKNPQTANIAAFFALVSATMWFFLFIVKLIALFKKHFASKDGLWEKTFLPSFLIVLPNVTLYALTFFRLVHYMGIQLDTHVKWLGFAIILIAFAFSTWYWIFWLVLLKEYFKKHFFKKEFYVTQWGLICPLVAYAVLGSFAYNQFFYSKIIYSIIVIFMIIAILAFFLLLIRHIKCKWAIESEKISCE